MKILIVDDDEKNRKLLRVILQHQGYETIEAKNGREAVNMAIENIPDLILMDIRMPVMDGLEAIRLLRSETSVSKIPVIVLTSSVIQQEREKIISESGCDGYITKPIDIQKFIETIKKYLEVNYEKDINC